MDSDEYKKMIQKKATTAKYRFSLMQPHTKRPLERRMTMFNPIDPNNSGMSFKFLVKDKSKAAI
jgi:hypothetical protein